MYTSITLLALTGLSAAAMPEPQPTWQSDYRLARRIGEREQKPLAVFVGSGTGGWLQLVREGRTEVDAVKLLAERYVCVFVDGTNTEGKRLAESFGLTGSRGLVISDRTGEYQAFRHDGDVSAGDLSRHLARYASPDFTPITTESDSVPPSVTTSNYTPATGPGYPPAAQMYPSAAPYQPYPAYGTPFAPAGNCPSCRRSR